MNKRDIILIAGPAAGVVVGAGLGYFFAQRRLDAKYNQIMEEEIARTKEFYSRLNKTGDFENPVQAVDALGLNEAVEALSRYQGETPLKIDDVEVEAQEPIVFDELVEEVREDVREFRKNVFETHNDDLVFQDRDTSKPYIINDDEWMGNEPEHEQVQLTWYADGVLADDADVFIDDLRIVGDHLEHFGIGASDPDVVMVRNEKMHMDYEIRRSEQKYEHVVAGFDNQLKHSDDNVRRIRPKRWDDE